LGNVGIKGHQDGLIDLPKVQKKLVGAKAGGIVHGGGPIPVERIGPLRGKRTGE